jgi:hypothetical protein
MHNPGVRGDTDLRGDRSLEKRSVTYRLMDVSSAADAIKRSLLLAIDYCRAAATKRSRHTDDEPEIVPTTAVVCLVDPHVGTEQTDEKRYRRDEPVPKARPKAGARCSWNLESRAWSRYRQDIGHLHLTTRRWMLDAYQVIVLHD